MYPQVLVMVLNAMDWSRMINASNSVLLATIPLLLIKRVDIHARMVNSLACF
jgi:hypothetical protein